MISFTLNGETVSTDIDANTPLLWVVRDAFKLKGSNLAAAPVCVGPAPCMLMGPP